jgi:hypothetical protein
VNTISPRNPEGRSRNPAGIILPAVICALICVFFNQSGALFIFSLVPIGLAGLMFSPLAAWFAVSYSILMYAGSLIVFQIRESINFLDVLLQTGVFSLLPVLFAWIIAPPAKGPAFLRVRTSLRFIISSIILLGIHIPLVYSLFQHEEFYQSFLADVESMMSIIPFASGSDVVEQSLMRDFFTPENIVNSVVFFGLRGGGLLSIMLFFFLNRQFSLMLTRIFRRINPLPGLVHFKIKSSFIWVLSLSILILLISLQFKFEIPEIIAWNIFVLCVMIYAAQGMGIVLFVLSRPSFPRGLRFLLNMLCIIMIFKVSVMMFFIAAMTVLGILEHWVSFRAPKTNGPPSTPKV